MFFDVLGPLRLTAPGGQLRIPSGASARAVCWLVANVNRPVSVANLAAVVWPDERGNAASKASALLRTLGPTLGDSLRVERGHAHLDVPEGSVDAVRFSRLVADGVDCLKSGDAEMAEADLSAALNLWRGDPYPELERALPAIATIDRLRELQLVATEELMGIALRNRVEYPLVAELRALVVEHPDRPRLWRQLALALYRTGRQLEALDVIADLRGGPGDEASLHALQSAILRQAPELAEGELAR